MHSQGPRWWEAARQFFHARTRERTLAAPPRIGLALGGGFARGIAHVGVLRVLEKNNVPIHAIAGVSAGAMVAAIYAAGCGPDEIESIARSMRFRDVARWTISRLGLVGSERMIPFLKRALKQNRFEDMKIPLAVIATDLGNGKPLVFQGKGDVVLPVRASCSYPGLFLPIRHEGRCLVDGGISMEVPAKPLRQMGVNRVISVNLPSPDTCPDPTSMFSVVNRCFQVLGGRLEREWRRYSDVVITPDVTGLNWDSFDSATKSIELGEKAATAALPAIRRWLSACPRVERAPKNAAAGLPVPAAR